MPMITDNYKLLNIRDFQVRRIEWERGKGGRCFTPKRVFCISFSARPADLIGVLCRFSVSHFTKKRQKDLVLTKTAYCMVVKRR